MPAASNRGDVNRNSIIGFALGAAIGCAGGFVFANNVNRRETENLRAELSRARAASAQQASANPANEMPPRLSPEELRAVVARADAEPRDIFLQRQLGQSLYLLAGESENNAALLDDAIRLLTRAERADPQNRDTLVLLGNAIFDRARAGDSARFVEARKFYERALRLRPGDAQVLIDLGLTYLYAAPADPRRAITEFDEAIEIEPQNPIALRHLAAALIATNDAARASEIIARLHEISPNDPVIGDLRAQLAARDNEANMRSAAK